MEKGQQMAQDAQQRLLHVAEQVQETAKEELKQAASEIRGPASKAS
jgi:hypothetical protein